LQGEWVKDGVLRCVTCRTGTSGHGLQGRRPPPEQSSGASERAPLSENGWGGRLGQARQPV